ncbi:MAG: biotin--[acetyl-CoA-carboxylase] ligase [Methanosarcinaceae archaeon]|nr:biotin--[acetyl-CoA-carboxylase] ligase [Methanosarcinaceae archaeon]
MEDKKAGIIRSLRDAGEKAVSGEELGKTIGTSRTMVWKYVKMLQDEGYVIESSPGTGYVLRSIPDKLYAEIIRIGLDTDVIGHEIHYFDEVDSTNNVAKEMGHNAPEGTIVISEIQTSGRGRKGHQWVSPYGGIWLSIILKPTISPRHASRMTLVAGIAVVNAMKKLGVTASLKWPNDVLVKGKKICGILTEMDAEPEHIDFVVVGIGINANINPDAMNEELRKTSTSLSIELGKRIDRADFVQSILYELEQEYTKLSTQSFSFILEEWMSKSDTIGRRVRVITPQKTIEGNVTGITADGALVLEKGDGTSEEIIAGQCIYL